MTLHSHAQKFRVPCSEFRGGLVCVSACAMDWLRVQVQIAGLMCRGGAGGAQLGGLQTTRWVLFGILDPGSGIQISGTSSRKADIRLPGKGNSNSHGATPSAQIIAMMKWIRTSRSSIKNSLSAFRTSRWAVFGIRDPGSEFRVLGEWFT